MCNTYWAEERGRRQSHNRERSGGDRKGGEDGMGEGKVRVGVVGTGIGRLHIQGYRQLKTADVIAVADLDRDRAESVAREYGIPRVFTGYQGLLEMDEIDAVSVCTPNCLHSEITVAALRAGKHVLCEKPLAVTVAEGKEMVEAARKSGKKLMIALNQRFKADNVLIKRHIDSGVLGEVYFGTTGWIRRKCGPVMGGWFINRSMSGGGPVIDLGVHMLDLALWFMGNPRPKSVVGVTYAKFENTPGGGTGVPEGLEFDVEDFAHAMIRLENGATLVLETSWAAYIKERERIFMSLLGTRGGLNLRPPEVYSEEFGSPVDHQIKAYETHGFDAEMAYFIDCVLNNTEPDPNGVHGLAILRVLEAIYRSADEGREVEVDWS